LAKRDRKELANRVCTVLDHLLRLASSPATEPRAGWRGTIVRVRLDVAVLLENKPNLRPIISTVIATQLPVARRQALLNLEEFGETPRGPLEQLSYTEEQVLGPWLPD
jgi:hypothetical protein